MKKLIQELIEKNSSEIIKEYNMGLNAKEIELLKKDITNEIELLMQEEVEIERLLVMSTVNYSRIGWIKSRLEILNKKMLEISN
jgi:hypothetical protein